MPDRIGTRLLEVTTVDVGLWIVLTYLAGIGAATLWWKRRARRAFTIDHIHVELHAAHIVDDRVIDAVWRAAISMTNGSRRPRALPVFGERAMVRAGNCRYLPDVYLETDVKEINPHDVALAWVEFVTPAAMRHRHLYLTLLESRRPRGSLRFVWGGDGQSEHRAVNAQCSEASWPPVGAS